MATLVVIPNSDYATFEAIRDEILDKYPYALMNDIFAKNKMESHFFFHDTKYIPPQLMKFALLPPAVKFDFSHINLPEVKE